MFKLKKPFKPSGDQPKAIKKLVSSLKKNNPLQTLLGVTGSGKSFTFANVIQKYGKPTIVLAHNKTLAFQLYTELRSFFPENKVEYFISYYDYYQPESYLPATDTFIEKDAQINPEIERMRLSATAAVRSRKDVIIVASVSAIYGLGNPEFFEDIAFNLKKDQIIKRRELLQKLLAAQYERNDTELMPGRFRVRGSVIDLVESYQEDITRITIRDEKIENIESYTKTDVAFIENFEEITIWPAKHFVTDEKTLKQALIEIKTELKNYLPIIKKRNQLFSYRLKQRVEYDIEMMSEMGYCNGIENYSRYFDRRKKGEKPFCLLDYMPKDFLLILDESHQTIPQIRAMYKGDRSRKESLVEYGFRMPSALDNRPLKFEEFEKYMKHTIFVSATPADYELENSQEIVEQIIRPTGLVDPEVEIRPSKEQMKDLIKEIKNNTKKNNRVLVTTLTKRLAEELTEYLANKNIKVRYMHSEINTIERTELIRLLRLGEYDVLVGINLLREGLDIPEVGLVAILDADKEGFLRNDKSLIQTIGRAARNVDGKVILYADKKTDSIKRTIKETKRRRNIQLEYNKKHSIKPKSIKKPVAKQIATISDEKALPKKEIPNLIIELEAQMNQAAEKLDFERAIKIRNKITQLKEKIKN